MSPLNVLLVEDSAALCRAFVRMFSRRKGFRVTVWRSEKLIDRVAQIPHGVVVIDAAMWSGSGQALTKAIGEIAVMAPIVLLGREDLLREQAGLILGGRVAFATHGASERFILGAVKAAARGEMRFENGVLLKLVVEMLGAKEFRGTAINREELILQFVANGKTNKEIGNRLGCSERSVKGHVTGLLRKAGVSKRSALASYAITNGLARLHHELPSRAATVKVSGDSR